MPGGTIDRGGGRRGIGGMTPFELRLDRGVAVAGDHHSRDRIAPLLEQLYQPGDVHPIATVGEL